jgi:hypothetical protein
MKTRSLQFYATADDISSIVSAVLVQSPMTFVQTDLYEQCPVLAEWQDIAGLFGIAVAGDQAREPTFLVLSGAQFVPRAVPQRDGSTKVAADQIRNPKSIILRPGGKWHDEAIIAGQVSTISEDTDSVALWNCFAQVIKKRWKKIQSYYVGTEALNFLRGGGRLTFNIKSPSEYDLRE